MGHAGVVLVLVVRSQISQRLKKCFLMAVWKLKLVACFVFFFCLWLRQRLLVELEMYVKVLSVTVFDLLFVC